MRQEVMTTSWRDFLRFFRHYDRTYCVRIRLWLPDGPPTSVHTHSGPSHVWVEVPLERKQLILYFTYTYFYCICYYKTELPPFKDDTTWTEAITVNSITAFFWYRKGKLWTNVYSCRLALLSSYRLWKPGPTRHLKMRKIIMGYALADP